METEKRLKSRSKTTTKKKHHKQKKETKLIKKTKSEQKAKYDLDVMLNKKNSQSFFLNKRNPHEDTANK